MKRSREFDWNFCFICQAGDVETLRHTNDGCKQLADRLNAIWELGGKLDFDVNAVAGFEV